MGDYGFAVAKPGIGKNVTDGATSELAASSAFNCFSVAYEGTINVSSDPSNPATSRASFAHALNFNPTMMAFAELSPGKYYSISVSTVQSNYHRFVYWSEGGFSPGDRKAIFSAASSSFSSYGSSVHTIPVKYFIFGDTANETGTASTLPTTNDYGIKVMKPGYDAKTDNYVEHIVWSSRFPPMKVAKIGSFTQTIAPTAATDGTVAHGLGYAPAFLVLRENGAGKYFPQPYQLVSPNNTSESWSDSTYLHFGEGNQLAVTGTARYRYIIFAEKASTT